MGWSLRLFILLLRFTVIAADMMLDYECYPNNTLVVVNPVPGGFYSAYANDSTTACDVSFKNNHTLIFISGCDKDDDILLHLADVNNSMVIGGIQERWNTIRCNEIASTGVERNIVQKFTPLLSSFATSVSPTVSTTLRIDSEIGDITSTAILSTVLYWTIDFPAEYEGLPLICTAYSGVTVGGSPSKVLINDGCSNDLDLVEHFSLRDFVFVVGGIIRRYYTKFITFKFYNSDFLTLHCMMRMCPENVTSCNYTCGSGRRRRDTSDVTMEDDGQNQQTMVTLRLISPNFTSGADVTRSGLLGPVVFFMVLMFIAPYAAEVTSLSDATR